MARRIYSPAISEDLIKPLYHYSKHIGSPMTKTVNRLITRGLLLEPLPAEAIQALPDHAIDTMRKKGLEDIALEKGDVTPVNDLHTQNKFAHPYLGIDDISQWYDDAMQGLARAVATKEVYCSTHSKRSKGTMGNWFYENAALNLGQVLYQSLTMATGLQLPIVDQVTDRYAR